MLLDTHAHLDYPEFAGDLDSVLLRAQEQGVTRVVTIGTSLESSRAAIAIAEKFQNVFAVVGFHPNDLQAVPDDIRPLLRDLVQHPKVVALGETGLDFHYLPGRKLEEAGNGSPQELLAAREEDQRIKEKQTRIFSQHLEVAQEFDLNVVIHQRDAFEETIRILADAVGVKPVKGVFHCFVNDLTCARRIFELGSMISFTGIVTFKNAEEVRTVVQRIPSEAFMLETDCPYLAPVPFRGRRAEPAHVRNIAEKVAETRQQPLEEIAAHTTANAERFFRFNRS